MVSIVEAPNFPAAPNTISELLNCFRVLSRVIPYIFEYGDSSEWEDKLFWVPRSVERLPTPAAVDDQEQDGQVQNNNNSNNDNKQCDLDIEKSADLTLCPCRNRSLNTIRYHLEAI